MVSFVERFIILCPYLGEFTIGASSVPTNYRRPHLVSPSEAPSDDNTNNTPLLRTYLQTNAGQKHHNVCWTLIACFLLTLTLTLSNTVYAIDNNNFSTPDVHHGMGKHDYCNQIPLNLKKNNHPPVQLKRSVW